MLMHRFTNVDDCMRAAITLVGIRKLSPLKISKYHVAVCIDETLEKYLLHTSEFVQEVQAACAANPSDDAAAKAAILALQDCAVEETDAAWIANADTWLARLRTIQVAEEVDLVAEFSS